MKKLSIVLFSILFALSISAEEKYSFRVWMRDLAEVLRSMPDQQRTEEELARLEGREVMYFESIAGTHWRYGFLGCPPQNPSCEIGVTDRSFGGGSEKMDAGFTALAAERLRLRCFREECAVRAKLGDKEDRATLRRGETMDVPMHAEIELAFAK